MFDWFRKNKKSEPKAPTANDLAKQESAEDQLSTQPDVTEVEAETPFEIPAATPAGEQKAIESTREEILRPLNESSEPEIEENRTQENPKKSFLTRFKEKLSGNEPAQTASNQPEQAEEEPAEAKPEISLGEENASTSILSGQASHPEQANLREAGDDSHKAISPETSATETGQTADEVELETNSKLLAEAKPEISPGEENASTSILSGQASQTEQANLREAGDDSHKAISPETSATETAQTAEKKPEKLASPSSPPPQDMFNRFREKLSATRKRLAGRIENLLSSVRSIDNNLLDELEELLVTSDLGIKTTEALLYQIRGQVASKELKDVEALKLALKKRLLEMVSLPSPPQPEVKPMVIMVVGINGVGKTTTIAKLARRFKEEGQKVLLAAGDTFRSAAVDQLIIWAERLGVDIISQPTGADASAVVFDALTAAQARGSDVVIIDTAGRLHTKVNLMDELKKIKRVANKAMPGAPHHTVLVLDGNTGQNAQRQAQTFHEAVGIDSIIVTKLDGTAKGGVIVSISYELKIPIAFVGLGESFEDLQPFDPEAFTEAILASN